jgi:digeranylgeranylglycerophospholipid reductase
MQGFDVVIVGAGPAGSHCARLLCQRGYQVLLIEQFESFDRNNFSSAATPLETLERFDLPEEVVGSFWKKIAIATSNQEQSWESPKNLGGVFDFVKLREFLVREVKSYNGEVRLGHRYLKHWQDNEKTFVKIKPKQQEAITVTTRVLVDATGYARAVMYPKKSDRPQFLKGTGIEYLIEIDEREYQKYSDALVFLMGYKWIPKGYSWIFPMGNNRVKVGSAWLDRPHQIVDRTRPLKDYITVAIKDYMKLDSYKLIDVHGSILEYKSELNDLYYRDNLIAIGDAVSTVNILGGEGIRHGMQGAAIASQYIQAYLEGKISTFQSYQKAMQRYFGYKWKLSDRISRRVYLEYSDEKFDRRVADLRYLSTQDITDLLFNYKFEKATKLLGYLLWAKVQAFFNKTGRLFKR